MTALSDGTHGRLRIMRLVRAAQALPNAHLTQLLQADCCTAMDARSAIGRHTLWSVHMHSLSAPGDREFLLGMAQVVDLAVNFGCSCSYNSGLLRSNPTGDGQSGTDLTDALPNKGLTL